MIEIDILTDLAHVGIDGTGRRSIQATFRYSASSASSI